VCLIFLALALEHLQDFIYYAYYTFYTSLLEEPSLHSFRSGIPNQVQYHHSSLDPPIPKTPGGLEVCLVFLTLALEHLQDFIYYAYTFYTGLLEEPSLRSFRSGWLKALGNLAQNR
jgi:hypothetical protein